MNPLDALYASLLRRDSLLDSLVYASPEEAVIIDQNIDAIMRRVVYLMGLIDWIES